MPVEIKIPSVGESITSGILARWLKKEGDQVREDEPLFELETEKATQEVPAPAAGILHISVPEGEEVPIGSVVGKIEPRAGGPAVDQSAKKEPAPRKEAARPPSGDGPVAPPAPRPASEEKVAVQKASGAATAGVVPKTEVQEHLEKRADEKTPLPPQAQPLVPRPPAGVRESRQRMSAIRQRIAERLLAAQKQTASLTTFNEADLSAIIDLRTRYKDKFKEMYNVGLGFMSFFVKAAVEALRAYPIVNARIDDADVVYQNYYNIGVAVSTDKGLMVPVLHDADQLSFADIEKAVASLAVRARDGKISVADLQGGTFTITNGGIFGSMLSTPILNPPQSAILGMHAIQKRPVVQGDQIVIRPMMYLALTYDHRLIDGRDAVLFLIRIKEYLEDPGRLLLEI